MIVLLSGAFLFVVVGVFLCVDARRERRETQRELVRERQAMREERAAHREERQDLLNRLAFQTGRPYEEPPIWAREREAEEEDDGLIVIHPEALVPLEFVAAE